MFIIYLEGGNYLKDNVYRIEEDIFYKVGCKNSHDFNVFLNTYSGKELLAWIREDISKYGKSTFSNFNGDLCNPCFTNYLMQSYYQDESIYALVKVDLTKVIHYSDDIKGDIGVITIGGKVKKHYLKLFEWIIDFDMYDKQKERINIFSSDVRNELIYSSNVKYLMIGGIKFNVDTAMTGMTILYLAFRNFDRSNRLFDFSVLTGNSYVADGKICSSIARIYTNKHWLLDRKTGVLTTSKANSRGASRQLMHIDDMDMRLAVFS